MFIRSLPLLAGVLPVVGVTLAYGLGVHHAVLPSCLPLLDGCTSISATGRYLPGSLLFRAVMLPQSVVLVFVWYFSARWLRELVPENRAAPVILIAGLVGALALVLYVSLLGTKAPLYEFMRRFGIYFYFLGTAVAQVALATSLWRYANRNVRDALRWIAAGMLLLCSLPFFLGVLNIVLKSVLADADLVENRIEWTAALLMQAYFVLLHRAWVESRFEVAVTTH
ncbi:MAG: hypothetical protein HKN64_05610 [Woeseiaceae bacterium]|nr:hypothetical protein [Woeseiaceae bacterium]